MQSLPHSKLCHNLLAADMEESMAILHVQLPSLSSLYFTFSSNEQFVAQKEKNQIYTYKIRNQAAIRKSSGGIFEVGFSIRPEIGLVKSCSFNVIVISRVEERVAKDEECRWFSTVLYELCAVCSDRESQENQDQDFSHG